MQSPKRANIADCLGGYQPPSIVHAQKVTSAEIMMCEFIAMHNLPFQAADYLTELFPHVSRL